jgi:acylglycerol lipase
MTLLLDTPLTGFESLAPDPTAALIIVHGLAEHAGRYRELAGALGERGISCFAFDQRGHGAAARERTHVDRFEHFVEDLSLAASAVRRKLPQLPVFAWGHSMGSIVAMAAVLSDGEAFSGVITTSNSLEVFRRGLNPLNVVFRTASRLAPRLRVPLGLDPARISSDEAIQRSYANDPLIPATASLRLIVEFAAWCERCREQADQIRLPWLVVHGEADEIAPVQGARSLFERLGSADKQLVIYPDLRHEVHNEAAPGRARFIDLVSTWIAERARRV